MIRGDHKTRRVYIADGVELTSKYTVGGNIASGYDWGVMSPESRQLALDILQYIYPVRIAEKLHTKFVSGILIKHDTNADMGIHPQTIREWVREQLRGESCQTEKHL